MEECWWLFWPSYWAEYRGLILKWEEMRKSSWEISMGSLSSIKNHQVRQWRNDKNQGKLFSIIRPYPLPIKRIFEDDEEENFWIIKDKRLSWQLWGPHTHFVAKEEHQSTKSSLWPIRFSQPFLQSISQQYIHAVAFPREKGETFLWPHRKYVHNLYFCHEARNYKISPISLLLEEEENPWDRL